MQIKSRLSFYQVDYCLYDELPDDIAYFHAQWRRERLTEKNKRLYNFGWSKRKRPLYRNLHGTYHTGTLLVGRGRNEVFILTEMRSIRPSVEQERKITLVVPGALPNRWMEKPWNRIITRRIWDIRIILPMTKLIHNFYHNDDCPPMRGFYRWHLQDPICFEEDLRVTIQQIGVGYRGLFERQDDVASVAYWYQTLPHAPFQPLMSKEDRWPR